MRGIFILLAVVSFTASCARSPVRVASAGDAIHATDAVDPAPGVIEMAPLYVDAREVYARKIAGASAAATRLCGQEQRCPVVRVRRADMYQRADGTIWTVVRINACGEERVYEETLAGWSDATARLR